MRVNSSSSSSSKLDIDGLTITLAPSSGKAKKSAGVDILSNAKLTLKEGRCYALVGRNGSGKSSNKPSPEYKDKLGD
jgi:ABC-type polysaccharide/polyol phosphate transport system ATPase subunit